MPAPRPSARVPLRADPPGAELPRAGTRRGRARRSVAIVPALATALLAALLAGCASTPPVEALPGLVPAAVGTPAQAERALALTEAERIRLDRIWARREYDCYQQFFVTRCLGRFRAEQRQAEQHLRQIDIRARQVLREDDALRRNADEAAARAEAAAEADAQTAQRQQAARERAERQQAQAAEQARRDEEAARLERERPAAQARQAGREAEAAARQRDKANEVEAAAKRPPRKQASPAPAAPPR